MSPTVVSIGEVLWDLLPSGPQLGGAPANLAVHVQSLGGRAALISRIGNDQLGRQAQTFLTRRGVDLSAVSVDPALPTGTVGVELDTQGQAHYQIHEPVAWDKLEANSAGLAQVTAADAICFGTLAQRQATSRTALHALLAAARSAKLRLCDINLRPPFCNREVIEGSLRLANALKLNETELPEMAALLGISGTMDQQIPELARRFGLKWILVTLGPRGSQFWSGGQWTHESGRTVDVRDTVGAGDAFTAAAVIGFLRGWPTPIILRRATDIAAFVCTQSGATPELPGALTAPFHVANS